MLFILHSRIHFHGFFLSFFSPPPNSIQIFRPWKRRPVSFTQCCWPTMLVFPEQDGLKQRLIAFIIYKSFELCPPPHRIIKNTLVLFSVRAMSKSRRAVESNLIPVFVMTELTPPQNSVSIPVRSGSIPWNSNYISNAFQLGKCGIGILFYSLIRLGLEIEFAPTVTTSDRKLTRWHKAYLGPGYVDWSTLESSCCRLVLSLNSRFLLMETN